MPCLGFVFLFLAGETQHRPWQRLETFGADLFLAIQAATKMALFQAGKRGANLPEYTRFAFQIASRQFALRGDVHLIECVWSFLYRDAFAPFELPDEFVHFGIQNRLEVCDFTWTHLIIL